MSTNILQSELESLIKMKADLIATVKTDAERIRLTPQLLALSKQISQSAKECEKYDIRSGKVLAADKAEAFAQALLAIFCEQLEFIPDYRDWPRQAIDIFPDPRVADAIKTLTAGIPGKFEIIQNTVAGIAALVESLKDEQSPDTTN